MVLGLSTVPLLSKGQWDFGPIHPDVEAGDLTAVPLPSRPVQPGHRERCVYFHLQPLSSQLDQLSSPDFPKPRDRDIMQDVALLLCRGSSIFPAQKSRVIFMFSSHTCLYFCPRQCLTSPWAPSPTPHPFLTLCHTRVAAWLQ